jgi:DNA modification methylase
MPEVADAGVDLAVTSPPYWNLKDYGAPGQIGRGQTLHEYLRSLFQVWEECLRVIREGGRLCINIGDQFARASIYGRYRVIPLHAEIIGQCEMLGFDFLGSIIWRKKTTVSTSGGAVIMGSFPYPPNGIVELDYEHILIFKRPGKPKSAARGLKEASRLSKEEWKTFFSGHWSFGGVAKKKSGHEAAFPEELPRRLIRMFSFAGDTVLDPFLGSGTTAKAGVELGRTVIGYEINEKYASSAAERMGEGTALFGGSIEMVRCPPRLVDPPSYVPRIADAKPEADAGGNASEPELHPVISVRDDCSLLLNTGEWVSFLGCRIVNGPEALRYLLQRIKGKKVILKNETPSGGRIAAYVYLKNRIFVNAHLLKSGAAEADGSEHRLKAKFEAIEVKSPGLSGAGETRTRTSG